MKRIGIFVIAYNAESHIEKTLARIPVDVWERVEVVYVIDDCSLDETVDLATSLKDQYPKLVVIRNRTNRRYGGNQKIGYRYAIKMGLDVIVMLHADGQYAPEKIMDLVQPILDEKADVVFGSRMQQGRDALRGGMPLYKYAGNRVLTAFQNVMTGMHLSEFHSGYRAYSTKFLSAIPFEDNTDEWHFDTQILLQANALGVMINEVPIPTYYGDEICHVNGLAYAWHCVLEAFRYLANRSGIVYSRIYDVRKKTSSRYEEKFDDPGSSHAWLWNELNSIKLQGAEVLELGVGDASLTRRLFDAGALVYGYEIDQIAAETARPYCRHVYMENIEVLHSDPLENRFDIVIAADVLEHLKDPEETLSRLKKVCKKDGVLLVSLPNFVNLYVRLNILLGRIPLHSKGLLDRTHLHIYTLSQMEQLLKKTGWLIKKRHVTSIPISIVFPFLKKPVFCWILKVLLKGTKIFPRLLGYQGVFVCENPNRSTGL